MIQHIFTWVSFSVNLRSCFYLLRHSFFISKICKNCLHTNLLILLYIHCKHFLHFGLSTFEHHTVKTNVSSQYLKFLTGKIIHFHYPFSKFLHYSTDRFHNRKIYGNYKYIEFINYIGVINIFIILSFLFSENNFVLNFLFCIFLCLNFWFNLYCIFFHYH